MPPRLTAWKSASAQFENAYRDQLQSNPQLAQLPEQFRQQLRENILEQLMQQRVIDNYLDEAGFQITDEQVTDMIQRAPEFQVDGKFDLETYRTLLFAERHEPAQFEAAQRRRCAATSCNAPLAARRW